MKRERISKKRTILKRIEDNRNRYTYIEKSGVKKSGPLGVELVTGMNKIDRNKLRIGGSPPPQVPVYIPVLKTKYPISIIITAYQTQNYIEECLDSIEAQTYFINNDDYEVLIGVDGCKKTLKKLLEIEHKYRNLSIFIMDKNCGTYVTSNTLLTQIKYDNILRFDSDDVMKPEMINEIMFFKDDYDVVQFLFSDFTTTIKEANGEFKYVAAGAHFYKKSVIELAGGYRNWKCAADSEFIKRIMKHTKIKRINKRLFYRRWHLGSITNKEVTNSRSVVRKNYMKKIRIYSVGEKIKIKPKTNTFIKIEKND